MMKSIAIAFTLTVAATPLLADNHAHSHAENHVALSDVAWVDAPIPGVQLALAWGDDATGARWLFKMEPGVAIPMHTHTNDYWGLTIQGNWVHVEPDGSEVPTGPGDYSLVPGGKAHADRCDGDIPCIGLLDFAGPRDVALVE